MRRAWGSAWSLVGSQNQHYVNCDAIRVSGTRRARLVGSEGYFENQYSSFSRFMCGWVGSMPSSRIAAGKNWVRSR